MVSPRRAKVSAEKRRELQVVAAVAREALLQTHVRQAVELIGLAGNSVSVMRMLDIYVRVNGLPRPDAELVTTRVLALLDEELHEGEKPAVYVAGEESVAGALPLVAIVRDRLRGRALTDLRRWVELHTGSTQVALLNVYVEHALRFVSMLEETHGIAAALRVYDELVVVPKTMSDMLHIFVLDRLAAEGLPTGAASSGQTPYPTRRGPRAVKATPAERRRETSRRQAVH